MLQRARDALLMLSMIEGFGLHGLWRIANAACGNQHQADKAVVALQIETGIEFKLTTSQWSIIRSEIESEIKQRRQS